MVHQGCAEQGSGARIGCAVAGRRGWCPVCIRVGCSTSRRSKQQQSAYSHTRTLTRSPFSTRRLSCVEMSLSLLFGRWPAYSSPMNFLMAGRLEPVR